MNLQRPEFDFIEYRVASGISPPDPRKVPGTRIYPGPGHTRDLVLGSRVDLGLGCSSSGCICKVVCLEQAGEIQLGKNVFEALRLGLRGGKTSSTVNPKFVHGEAAH